MRPFAVIVALDSQYGIGRQGQLPWHLPSDLRHFKDVTSHVSVAGKRNAVIMGRKTWESLPGKFRPLPQRLNIVLSGNPQIHLPPGVLACASLDQALDLELKDIEQVFVIGGGQVFVLAMSHPLCRQLRVTHVKGDFSCDVFFPLISRQFVPVQVTEECQENGFSYHFCDYLKHE